MSDASWGSAVYAVRVSVFLILVALPAVIGILYVARRHWYEQLNTWWPQLPWWLGLLPYYVWIVLVVWSMPASAPAMLGGALGCTAGWLMRQPWQRHAGAGRGHEK